MRITALGAALLAVLLVGCSTGPGSEPSTPAAGSPTVVSSHAAPRTVPAGMGSGQPDGVFPRAVKHFAGSTDVPALPQRIAVISTGQLDGLLTLGVVPAGTTRARGAELIPAYLTSAFPDQAAALVGLADLGQRVEPQVEAVATLAPDLILANSTVDAAVLAQFGRIAPTVVTGGTGVNWKQDFLLLADAVGQTGKAQAFLDQFHQDAAALGSELDPVPTISFTRATADGVRIFGVASFTGSIAEDAGLGRPPTQQFDDTSKDLSAEQIDQAGADWSFYGVQGGEANEKQLTGSSLWRGLPAVIGGQTTAVDDEVWYLNAGPTAARQVLDGLGRQLA